MLTPKQREELLNSSDFQKLFKKTNPTNPDAGLSYAERARRLREQREAEYTPEDVASGDVEEGGFFNRLKETGGDILETVRGAGEALGRGVEGIKEDVGAIRRGEVDPLSGAFQTASNVASAFTGVSGELSTGIGKALLSQEQEDKVKEKVANIAREIAELETVKKGSAWYKEFKKNNPTLAGNIEAGASILGAGTEVFGFGKGANLAGKGLKATKEGVEQAGSAVSAGVRAGAENVGNMVKDSASAIGSKARELSPSVSQKVEDFFARVPRAVEHIKDNLDESAIRAEKIRQSSPAVGEAIRANVPERTLNNVLEATPETKKKMREMMDIAESSSDIKPSSLAGESAYRQYEIVDNARKEVGERLNEAISSLPDTKVSMSRQLANLDRILSNSGLRIKNKNIVREPNSNITDAELKAINKLYKESIRGIDNLGFLDAKTIQSKNSLISKLRRESSSIDNVGDIIINTPDGERTSIYNAFKDMFSNTLDDISPEIRGINKEYATYRNIIDEMDNSIFKTSKTDMSIDPALSASINLRRVSGEAMSTPYFQEVARAMDATARKLGYDGADPVRLVNFAEDLRKIYPDTIPRTGFQGGVRTGIVDLAEKFINTGTPNAKDQQKAIKKLLEEADEIIKENLTQ